jgi:hypothetical protein
MTGEAPGKYTERRPQHLEPVDHDVEIGETMGDSPTP